ncbi:Conserved_hypothetical protein [Hexamita inflata]|uniref:Uncharacterized protein n=1 Tax=Hexamita inflata TaxID=28002 RepID=A0AA86NRZ9_9EUKA|nr:Conserved hypothetical protein [Hexamita inflata]
MSQTDVLHYAQQHKLPEPLLEFIKSTSVHLCLFGGQHSMFNNRVTDEMLVDICAVLKQIDIQQITLDLGCNKLTDACITTLEDLFRSKQICGLSLRGNYLTEKCGPQLAQLIKSSKLQYLSLAENKLDNSTEIIVKSILDAPALHYGVISQESQPQGTLQYLDLKQTGITERAIIHLADFLKSRFCGLRELQLGHSALPTTAFERLNRGIKFNTSLEALTIKCCEHFEDDHAVQLIKNLIAVVPTEDSYIYQSDNQLAQERIDQMIKLQQWNSQKPDMPKPLNKGQAITPLQYLDISSNLLCFDYALELKQHFQKDECCLKTLILDGTNLKNQGANALAEGLLKYTVKLNEEEEEHDLFGCFDTDEGYDQHYKNITMWNMIGDKRNKICLSLRRTQIGGQGLCALAVLCKLNKEVQYLALEGNTLNVEYGETSNEKTVWHPQLEWETTFEVRNQTGRLITDFGLERSELERGRLLFYRKYQHVLKAMNIFE